MFTGIICAQGITLTDATTSHLKLKVPESNAKDFKDVVLGESIAVNGVCLTVTKIEGQTVEFYVSPETLQRSNLGDLKLESRVNLERALRASDRLSGHIVQGHVDDRGRIHSIQKIGESHEIAVEIPAQGLKFVIEKGSIALDGISLTINSIRNSTIYLMIIPHTWAHTNLSTKHVGESINIEYDVVLKHITRLAQFEKR